MSAQTTYPVLVTCTIPHAPPFQLARLGGGARTLGSADDFYPTRLWYIVGRRHPQYIDPSEHGITAVSIDAWNTGDDPMSVAGEWPIVAAAPHDRWTCSICLDWRGPHYRELASRS